MGVPRRSKLPAPTVFIPKISCYRPVGRKAQGFITPRLNRPSAKPHLDDQLKTFGIWSDWESGKRGRKD